MAGYITNEEIIYITKRGKKSFKDSLRFTNEKNIPSIEPTKYEEDEYTELFKHEEVKEYEHGKPVFLLKKNRNCSI